MCLQAARRVFRLRLQTHSQAWPVCSLVHRNRNDPIGDIIVQASESRSHKNVFFTVYFGQFSLSDNVNSIQQ